MGTVITFHPSADGSTDYLDLHTPDGDRFYLDRDEARRLAAAILRDAAEDVVCEYGGRLNGVPQVRNDADGVQWCDGAPQRTAGAAAEPSG